MKFSGTNYRTIEEFLKANGCDPAELLQSRYYAYDFSQAYRFLQEAISKTGIIYIIGDYDVDGIVSTHELSMIIKALGGYSVRRIPRRISEGYGLNPKIVAEIPDNAYMITVDNGISAHEAVKLAKQRGIRVMILDHHLPDTDENGNYVLPNADVIYDPHIDHAEFREYCAAGIVYKLAEYLFGNTALTASACVLAAIGTVADMVELKGDNRNLVKAGLALMNQHSEYIPLPVRILLEVSSLTNISEQDISFKLAPIINARGRLEDNGAQFVSDFFTEEEYNTSYEMGETLVQANTTRQQMESECMKGMEKILQEEDGKGTVCVFYPDIPEGIIGLLAGKLSERFHTASFVMTECENGMVKGSARGAGRLHIKETLEKCRHLLVKSGGHKGAGGFSLEKKNLEAFMKAVKSEPLLEIPKKDYDIDIRQSEMALWYHSLQKFAPYGAGVPEPVFHIGCFEAYPRFSKFAEGIGVEKQHLKVYGSGCDCIGFRMYKDYQEMNQPKRLELTGKLGCNHYNGKQQIQFRISQMAKYERKEEKSREALILERLAGGF